MVYFPPAMSRRTGKRSKNRRRSDCANHGAPPRAADCTKQSTRPSPTSLLIQRLRAAPYTIAAIGVLLAAAYLCLVNLDYAALWHDEAPSALIGKNLMETGDISGWDGRNLVGGTNGRTLNAQLRDVLPPLTYLLNAATFNLLGVSVTTARLAPALVGILSLGLLFLLLRQHLPNHPRLVFLMFLFAAWSPQLLLYFRQSRYYAFMVFGVIAAFYLYECWWRSGRIRHLAALALVAALAFFNHYAGGAATMLALATWHLSLRAKATTPRQWLELTVGGLVVVALGGAYLFWLGVIGGERSGGFLAWAGMANITEYHGALPVVLIRLWIYTRDLFTTDWISWPVFLWFAGTLAFIAVRRRRGARPERNARAGSAKRRRADDLPLATVGRVVLMGALFALFSTLLSEQPVWNNPVTALRYYVGALPLLLAMKGLFAEWAWRRSKFMGTAALAVLLLSSAGAWPFNMNMNYTGERTLGLHLPQFVREIHRPYRSSTQVVSDYLLEHAEQDDLVYVPDFADRETLIFTIGHHVLFCCVLNELTPLPPEKVAALPDWLSTENNIPDWIIMFGKVNSGKLKQIEKHYVVVAEPDVFFYPTQRPELNWHAFTPLSTATAVAAYKDFRVRIFKLRDGISAQ